MIIDGITINSQLRWSDEYTATPYVSNIDYSTNGKAHIKNNVKNSGVPMTLESGGNSVITLSELNQLKSHVALMKDSFNITLDDGTTHLVQWDYSQAPVSGSQVFRDDFEKLNDDLMNNIILRFITYVS